MKDVLHLVNEALFELGEEEIKTLDATFRRARVAKKIVENEIGAYVRQYPFSCLMAQRTLSPAVGAPSKEGYSFGFLLPPDCAKVWEVSTSDYSLSGRYLFANTDVISLTYTKNPGTDVAQLDDAAYKGLVYSLAARLCRPLGMRNSDKRDLLQEARGFIDIAIHSDSAEVPPEQAEIVDDFLSAMHGPDVGESAQILEFEE